MSTAPSHARPSSLVDAHFEGRASPREEAELRAHLPACERCRRRYGRQLLLSKLDPGAARAEDRLAAGLGLGPRRVRRGWLVLAPVAVAAVALALAWPAAGPAPEDGLTAPVARGGVAAPSLFVFRVGAGGAPAPVGARVAPGDELAFAYANPGDRKYFLLYGVDEHGHVYWYFPSWPAGASPPRAVAARAGAGPHELREAIRHKLDGRRLRLVAVFTDEPLGVGAFEGAARAGASAPVAGVPSVPGAAIVTRTLEVGP